MESIDTQIENGLQVLDQKEASLIELRSQFTGLSISGLEDREGYKAVREARIALKNARVQIQKDGKELRENAVKFQKRVIEREKELIAIIEPTESELEQIEDHFIALQEAERQRKEREENERIQKRVDALAKFNYAIDLYEAKIMPEENFQALLGHAEADYLKEQERIAAEKAEAERLKRKEEERLTREREELAKQRAEQEKREAELKRLDEERQTAAREYEAQLRAEREKLEAERRALAEYRFNQRKHILASIGLVVEELATYHPDLYIEVTTSSIRELDDVGFEMFVEEATAAIEQAKKEAAEKARLEEQEKAKREAEEKAECERLAKIEAERQEALKPDKEKLLGYLNHVCKQVPCADLKDPEAKKLQADLFGSLDQLYIVFQQKIEQL